MKPLHFRLPERLYAQIKEQVSDKVYFCISKTGWRALQSTNLCATSPIFRTTALCRERQAFVTFAAPTARSNLVAPVVGWYFEFSPVRA
eukprot:g15328.t1